MRSEQFQFTIDGKGVTPRTVPVRDLLDVLSKLEAAIAVTARSTGAKKADDLMISLLDIKAGSDTAVLAVSPRMYRAAMKVSRAIADGDYGDIPQAGQNQLRQLWKKAQASNYTFRLNGSGNGLVQSEISPSREILRPGSISGRTTLYGLCERVGGVADQTMQFRLLSGELHTIRIAGKPLAQKIGGMLFQTIGIEGEATWDVDSWTMSDFTADALVEDYKKKTPVEAFAALADVAGDMWNDIDPDEYVSELRSD